ncbi:hypothetical protein HAX54_013841 [Datura stramonium]|uniref:Uncharacterized protein n=1 Tax=Datura stramonium TaxID=4076 RepID=A0ABS8TPJ2_DATST|nr:hypothetical protein [Datura stramonium]
MEKRIGKLLLTKSHLSRFAFWGMIYSYCGHKCLDSPHFACAMHNCSFYAPKKWILKYTQTYQNVQKFGIEEKKYTQSFGELHVTKRIQLLAKVGAIYCILVTDELLQDEDEEENWEVAIDKVISFRFCLVGNDIYLLWTQVVGCCSLCLCNAQLQFLWYGRLSISMSNIDTLPSKTH